MSYSRADQTLELPTTGAFVSAQRRPRTRRPSRAPRFLVAVLFLAYLVLLTWLIVWKLEAPFVGWGEMRALKLVPFVASEGYAASLPLEVLANVAVFIPFGLCTGYLWRRAPGPKTFFAAGFASLAMETTQFALAVGSFDTSDIIANTVGALIGAAVVAPSVRRSAFS
ncbi:VanZ family protein [Pseudoclavibacter sp. RFBA6]|uniref:VanZ family protein n=1 Tax=Pseudoclavibacter sp. RFBA6 TaxID=2080573 RepID=UPI0015E1F4BB|nr:VanZ family protein [Pseudoclavibacter sp. RFBA6]